MCDKITNAHVIEEFVGANGLLFFFIVYGEFTGISLSVSVAFILYYEL